MRYGLIIQKKLFWIFFLLCLIFLDIFGYFWIFLDIFGYFWINLDNRTYAKISTLDKFDENWGNMKL